MDFHPARIAVEDVSEIQCHGEQAIAHRDGGIRQNGTLLSPANIGVIEDEAQIVAAVGVCATGAQPPLVGEGGALGECGQASNGCEQSENESDFHMHPCLILNPIQLVGRKSITELFCLQLRYPHIQHPTSTEYRVTPAGKMGCFVLAVWMVTRKFLLAVAAIGQIALSSLADWQLVWSDEFD